MFSKKSVIKYVGPQLKRSHFYRRKLEAAVLTETQKVTLGCFVAADYLGKSMLAGFFFHICKNDLLLHHERITEFRDLKQY
jgi:hypothetical protein